MAHRSVRTSLGRVSSWAVTRLPRSKPNDVATQCPCVLLFCRSLDDVGLWETYGNELIADWPRARKFGKSRTKFVRFRFGSIVSVPNYKLEKTKKLKHFYIIIK